MAPNIVRLLFSSCNVLSLTVTPAQALVKSPFKERFAALEAALSVGDVDGALAVLHTQLLSLPDLDPLVASWLHVAESLLHVTPVRHVLEDSSYRDSMLPTTFPAGLGVIRWVVDAIVPYLVQRSLVDGNKP